MSKFLVTKFRTKFSKKSLREVKPHKLCVNRDKMVLQVTSLKISDMSFGHNLALINFFNTGKISERMWVFSPSC